MMKKGLIFFCSVAIIAVIYWRYPSKPAIDHFTIIEAGIEHLFRHQKFSPEFYRHPLQIVKSFYLSHQNGKRLNRKPYYLIDKAPCSNERDWQHPLPYLEIWGIVPLADQAIRLQLFFNSIGKCYTLDLYEENHQWKVRNSNYANIKMGC
ncbi:hypothetical protein [Siphonobacter sp. SORGH_AS_1065]|uniref:hypothetical protein n=1 Tax=Siphonobacter sp. SORGH_AS_1065 TaxID=3041795 RepID=UPI00278868CF|nr:hypothetical protein [Siphonobacter sp. SORGH_AS_1065]MDQ1090328.1 hypothetical protein [Siphonobacter sp. SORGH_AS_1065]